MWLVNRSSDLDHRVLLLVTLGEWMNTSAGFAFAPHVISVGAGEVSSQKKKNSFLSIDSVYWQSENFIMIIHLLPLYFLAGYCFKSNVIFTAKTTSSLYNVRHWNSFFSHSTSTRYNRAFFDIWGFKIVHSINWIKKH